MAHRTVMEIEAGKDGMEVVRDPSTGDFGIRQWRRSPSGVLRASHVTWITESVARELARKILEGGKG